MSVFELRAFGLSDLLICQADIREVAAEAKSLEAAATEIARYLHEHLLDKEAQRPATALVRLYKTHPFDQLEPELQEFAVRAAGGIDLAGAPCLTLLGTAGVEPVWNDRRRSQSHRAIPLPSPEALTASPMIFQLVRQLGFEEAEILAPDPGTFRSLDERAFDVFFVDEAKGSPHVPDQDFVEAYGVRSVVGFGGVIPPTSFFAVVLFATVPVSAETAEVLGSVAAAVKLALLPFVERTFDTDPPFDSGQPSPERDLVTLRSQVTALEQLVEVRQSVVVQQAVRLEQTVQEAEERAAALERSQAELQKTSERFARLATTLQRSLLPPSLPAVPGMEVAAAYHAAAHLDGEVGGDFYDLFETARDDWAIVLGDVMGKGADAAALTALTRYTLRAAAVGARRPRPVLATLNEVLHRQDTDRFCTVTYARLRTGGGKMRMTLASGGHPPPILVARGGGVVPLHAPGPLIGPFEHWDGKERRVVLQPGDAVVFYSDGVTDARAAAGTLETEGLMRILEGTAGLSASEIVAAVERGLADYAGTATDDVAILAVRVKPDAVAASVD
jgi:serine phosphatase RsbU (regulator of sigma subunit)